MDLGLENRVAFVTGASSGLGRQVALELAVEGCRVALCSRSKQRIDEAAAYIVSQTGVPEERLLPIECDVTDEARVREVIDQVSLHFGALHILVTNAGGPPAGFVEEFTSEDYRRALDLNLMSTINLCRYALVPLRAAAKEPGGFARIVMVTSISAKQPIANLYLSNIARAGVQGFAKSLSEELGPDGITVNTVLPGYTRTERLEVLSRTLQARTGESSEEIEAGWARNNALKRIGSPEEFSAAVAFLCSRRASYITGTAFTVDGGSSKGLL